MFAEKLGSIGRVALEEKKLIQSSFFGDLERELI